MCGIVGVAGDINYQLEQVFSHLLKLDIVRGHHSTGVIVVRENKDVEYDKVVGTAFDLFDESSLFTSARGTLKGRAKVLIGHNRFATAGSITEENAHPFDHGSILGIHNGTLQPPSNRNLEMFHKFDTDSEALYYQIAKDGLRKVIPTVAGAWSLCYYDTSKDAVFFLRNSQRPMCYAYVSNHNAIIWASEAWMIEVACAKFNITVSSIIETDVDKIYEMQPWEKNSRGKVKFIVHNKELKGGTETYSGHVLGRGRRSSNNQNFPHGTSGDGTKEHNQGNLWEGVPDQRPNKNERNGRGKGRVVENNSFVSTLANSKEPIPVIYPNHEHLRRDSNKFITLYTIDRAIPVRLLTPGKADVRKDIINTGRGNEGFWTVKPNAILQVSGENSYEGLLSQINSAKGPFKWSELTSFKGFEDYDKPNDDVAYCSYFQGREIPKDLWQQWIDRGCGFCSDTTTRPSEHRDVIWLNNDTYLCPGCADNKDIQRELAGYGIEA